MQLRILLFAAFDQDVACNTMHSQSLFKDISHFRKQFSVTKCLLDWLLFCSPQTLTESLTVTDKCEIFEFNSGSLYHPKKDPAL